MGNFTQEPKPGGGYYLLYYGKYVFRQQNNEQWIKFETQDANFNPDYFEVLNNADWSVRAKFLKYRGEYVQRFDGNPIIVPYTFDFEQFIAKYKSLSAFPPGYIKLVIANNFWQGHIDDLQRSYDGGEHPLAMSFTAGASFVYGVACSQVGLSVDDSLFYGGLYNYAAGKNPEGELYNNPNNPPNIRSGYDFVYSLQMPNSRINKADTNKITYDFTVNPTTPEPTNTGVVTPVFNPTRYFLEFEIKSGDSWDTLVAIYGVAIRDLPEYGTTQSPGAKRFHIEVTGDELAKLYYNGKLRPGDRSFAIIGDGGLLSHLSAHFAGDEITADRLAQLNIIEKSLVHPGQTITIFSLPNSVPPERSDQQETGAQTAQTVQGLADLIKKFGELAEYYYGLYLGPGNRAWIVDEADEEYYYYEQVKKSAWDAAVATAAEEMSAYLSALAFAKETSNVEPTLSGRPLYANLASDYQMYSMGEPPVSSDPLSMLRRAIFGHDNLELANSQFKKAVNDTIYKDIYPLMLTIGQMGNTAAVGAVVTPFLAPTAAAPGNFVIEVAKKKSENYDRSDYTWESAFIDAGKEIGIDLVVGMGAGKMSEAIAEKFNLTELAQFGLEQSLDYLLKKGVDQISENN